MPESEIIFIDKYMCLGKQEEIRWMRRVVGWEGGREGERVGDSTQARKGEKEGEKKSHRF